MRRSSPLGLLLLAGPADVNEETKARARQEKIQAGAALLDGAGRQVPRRPLRRRTMLRGRSRLGAGRLKVTGRWRVGGRPCLEQGLGASVRSRTRRLLPSPGVWRKLDVQGHAGDVVNTGMGKPRAPSRAGPTIRGTAWAPPSQPGQRRTPRQLRLARGRTAPGAVSDAAAVVRGGRAHGGEGDHPAGARRVGRGRLFVTAPP